jgi:Ca-activated chloride channel homolog
MIVLSLLSIIVGAGKSEVREVIEKKKQNILIVLDISRSMLAEDISPSRIEAAKQTIATFLTERRDDAFGLIVFAGKPFVSIPFSTDTQGISSVLANLNTYYIRQDLP